MKLRITALTIAAGLLLVGCGAQTSEIPESTGESGASTTPTTTPTETGIESAKEASDVTEIVEYILAQDPGSMTSEDIMDAAGRLRVLAGDHYAEATLGDIQSKLLGITLDGIDYELDQPVPDLQAQLVELTKQVRDLG